MPTAAADTTCAAQRVADRYTGLYERVSAADVPPGGNVAMAPWPYQPCPHPSCRQPITDLLAEMLPNADRTSPEFKSVVGQMPGGAITCPYCQEAVEYGTDGATLAVSAKTPLRYSRAKMEMRATDYGSQKSPPDPGMTPEQWIAEEKLMPGALQGYKYVEDLTP